MATVATISIKLDAQTAALKKGFQDTAKASKNLSNQLKTSLGSGIMRLNAGLNVLTTTLSTVRSAFASFRQNVDEVADLADFADRIQISVEQLQALQQVAETSGSSASVLNTALQRMQRRIADAANAGGPLAERLKDMGLSVQELVRLSPDQQFLRVADAVRELGTRGEKTAAIMALMDTEGVSLVEMLDKGSEALGRNIEQVKSLGLVTDETARKMQEMSSQLKDMETSWQNQSIEIQSNMIPAIEALYKVLTALSRFYQGFLGSIRNFGNTASWTDPNYGRMNVLEGFDERQEMRQIAQRIADAMGTGTIELNKVSDKLKDSGKVLRKASEMLNIPGVGAYTSTTAGGFSALHDAQRRAQQRAIWEKDVLGVLTDIRDESRTRPTPTPVSIL